MLIINTGNDTVWNNFRCRVLFADEDHQQEIENDVWNFSMITPNDYLAPGDSVYYNGLLIAEEFALEGFSFPCNVCFEMYDPSTFETCARTCLLVTDCDGERIININRDYICQNQPYDFFGQQITAAGTYHHYDSTEACILHYILYQSSDFVFPEPLITISGDTSFCEGGETILTASSNYWFYNNSSLFHLLWSDGTTTPDIHITTGGTYTVTASYHECTASNSVTITVLPVPDILFDGELEHCDGTPVTLQVVEDTLVSYSWSDGTSGNHFTTSQSGDYEVTAVSDNGCSNSLPFRVTAGMSSDTTIYQTVSYYLAFNGSVFTRSGHYTVIIPNASGCDSVIRLNLTVLWPNETIVFYDTTCVGTPYTQFGLDTVFDHIGNFALRISSAHALQLHVVDFNPVIVASRDLNPCENDTITLSVEGDAQTYHWNTGAETRTISVTTPGFYSAFVTNALGCTKSTDYFQVGHSRLLSAVPEICMATAVPDECFGINWSYHNSNAVSYNVYGMADNSGEYRLLTNIPETRWSTAPYLNPFNLYSYTYRISAVDACGAESDWSEPVHPIYLTASYNSDSSIHLQWTAYEGADVSYYRVILVVNSSNFTVGTTTDVSFDVVDNYYTLHYSGDYCIEAITNSNCTYPSGNITKPRSNRIDSRTVQIAENATQPELVVFPNPTSDVINIQIKDFTDPSANIEIYDLCGRLITREQFTGATLQVNTASYTSGVYIIRAVKESGVIGYCKFVKN